jgi:putative transposase
METDFFKKCDNGGMRNTQFAENEFYHLYNRGVDKRIVFATKDDYDRFKAYLYLLNDTSSARTANLFIGKRKQTLFEEKRNEPLVAIGAYCIMPTHFHILATPLVDDGIPKFMHKLQTAYTMYFNEKTLRTGSLFQGTYKSKHAATDEYLKYLFAYIHLNPVKYFHEDIHTATPEQIIKVEAKVSAYPYSSVGEYLHSKFVITSPEAYPKYFTRAKDMQSHLNFWLKYRSEGVEAGY